MNNPGLVDSRCEPVKPSLRSAIPSSSTNADAEHQLKNQFGLEPWQINHIVEFLMIHSEKQKRVTQLLYDIQLKEADGYIENLPAYIWKALQQDLDLQQKSEIKE